MTRPSLLCLVAVLLASSVAAAADDQDPDSEIARRHFDAGTAAYDAHDYPTALREFEAARAVRPKPELDFNIARCLDRMERFKDAIAGYQRYLAGKPDAPDAAEVRERVATLQARVAADEAAARAADEARARDAAARAAAAGQARAAADADARAQAVRRRRIILSSVVGAGALAAAGVGGGLYGWAASDFNRLKPMCPCVSSQSSDIKLHADLGYAFFGLAGALAATDVVLWIWTLRRPHAPRSFAWGRY